MAMVCGYNFARNLTRTLAITQSTVAEWAGKAVCCLLAAPTFSSRGGPFSPTAPQARGLGKNFEFWSSSFLHFLPKQVLNRRDFCAPPYIKKDNDLSAPCLSTTFCTSPVWAMPSSRSACRPTRSVSASRKSRSSRRTSPSSVSPPVSCESPCAIALIPTRQDGRARLLRSLPGRRPGS